MVAFYCSGRARARMQQHFPSEAVQKLAKFVGRRCPWCRSVMTAGRYCPRKPTRDHLVPRSRTEPGILRITVVVCSDCNISKKHYTIHEWIERLKAGGDRRAAIVETWMLENYGLVCRAEQLLAEE